MSDTKETQEQEFFEVENHVFLNEFFSKALQKAATMVWGLETDEAVFRIFDAVAEAQSHLQRMYKKYSGDAETSPEDKAENEKLWLDLLASSTKVPGPRVVLTLSEKNNFSAMERFQLRPVFDIKKK